MKKIPASLVRKRKLKISMFNTHFYSRINLLKLNSILRIHLEQVLCFKKGFFIF